MTQKLIKKTIVSLLFLLTATLGFAQTTPQEIPKAGFSFGPVKKAVGKGTNIYFEMKENSSEQDIMKLMNYNSTPLDVKLDAVEVFINSKNEQQVKLEKDVKENVANWITFPNGNEVTLEGNQSIELPYVINVPAGTEQKEYIGALTATVKSQTDDRNVVKSNFRIANKFTVKVTDEPQSVQKIDYNKAFVPETPTKYYYLIGSIAALALVLTGTIVYKLKSKKKHKK